MITSSNSLRRERGAQSIGRCFDTMSGTELSHVRTELHRRRILTSVPPHPVQTNRQPASHRYLGNAPVPTNRQAYVATPPIMVGTRSGLSGQQLPAPTAGLGGERQLLQLRSSLCTPQFLAVFAFVHGQRLQLIGDPCAHLHQSMPVPEQLLQISILRTRYPDPRKAIFNRSVLCFLTRRVLISAALPIHSSKPSSASKRSNQREKPVASIPTHTLIPRCFRSR
jgi:hypothetical protein